jgi:serine/threonine-protein kinase
MITAVRAGENSLRWPQVLPGGKAVLFGSNKVLGNFDESDIEVVTLADGHRRAILEHAGMPARYLPSGHLVFVNKGTLYAVPFDLGKMEVRGKPVPVLEEVVSDSNYGSTQIVFASNGTLLYRRGRTVALHKLDWMDDSGNLDTVAGEPAKYQFPRVSPDGSRIAVVVTDSANSVLWIYDWQRGSKSRLTIGPGVNTNPVWSPDGRYLVFQAPGGIWWARADGAGQPQTLIKSESVLWPGSFTGDGTRMVFSELDTKGGSLIKTASVSGNSGQPVAGQPEPYLQAPGSSATPAFSPDGRWLAYADAESGSYEVYVRAFPDTGTKWQISTAGGEIPVWSRNKSEVYYRTEEQEIMVAAYSVQGNRFSAEKPRRWSPKRMANIGLTPNLDITPDSKRMITVMPVENDPHSGENQRHVVLVLNFFDELRRRIPDGK